MKIDFENAKMRVIELIDNWCSEVIDDMLMEIQSAAKNKNIRDIELTLDSIRDTEKQAFEIKQSIIKSTTIRQVFLSLNCEIFDDVEEQILSKFLDTSIFLKK